MGLLHEIVHVDDKLILRFYVVSTLMFMWIVRLSSCEAFGPFFLRPTTLRTKDLAWLTLRRKKSPHTPCFPRLDTDRRPLGSSDTLRSALSTRNNSPQYHLHNNRHWLANIIIRPCIPHHAACRWWPVVSSPPSSDAGFAFQSVEDPSSPLSQPWPLPPLSLSPPPPLSPHFCPLLLQGKHLLRSFCCGLVSLLVKITR